MLLLFMAILPVIAICAYIYRLDRYEKEPVYLLTLSLFYGSLTTCAIIPCEVHIISLISDTTGLIYAFFMSFAAIAPVEEGFKFTVLYLLLRCNSNLNEAYDSIVYAVFVSLGFALVENVFYVFNPSLGGYTTAIMRAVFSVPGHGVFGIFMGYCFSAAVLEGKKHHIVLALLLPYMLHSVYDFILLSRMPFYLIPFAAFILWLFVRADRLISSYIVP